MNRLIHKLNESLIVRQVQETEYRIKTLGDYRAVGCVDQLAHVGMRP
jgi:hypothetical protein